MPSNYAKKRLDEIREMQIRSGDRTRTQLLKANEAGRSKWLIHKGSDGVLRKYAPGTTEKPCTQCKVVKPLDEFSPFARGALGRQPRCKACICLNGKAYTRKTRESKAGRPRPDVCDACGRPPQRRALHWDHDHERGGFRGWLCHGCNTALGGAGDSVERLSLLIQYLTRGGGPG